MKNIGRISDANNNRNELAKGMSPSEIAEAQALTGELGNLRDTSHSLELAPATAKAEQCELVFRRV